MAHHKDYYLKIAKEKSRKLIYNAMDSEDMAGVVLTAINIIQSCSLEQPPMKTDQKHNIAEGKFCMENNENKKALIAFNKAICGSPKNSSQQLRAYVTRTFFLCKIRDIKACLKGIEICRSLKMTYTFANIIEDIATNCAISLHLRPTIIKQPNLPKTRFFNNTQSAIAEVQLTFELGNPVIKAGRAIPVGTLVSLEKPFVSLVDRNQRYTSCHHCHLVSANLIPCEECCYAMYCGDKCKRIAMKQYHAIECQISDLIEDLNFNTTERLMIKAVIKMKVTGTWWDLIRESDKLCENQNGCPSCDDMNEIFNRNNSFSLLKCRPKKIFIHGKIFNASFRVAAIIKRLTRVNFFPLDASKEIAVRAFARVMMHLVVFPPQTVNITNCEVKLKPFSTSASVNHGWFSFTSRLRHSCDPNLLQIGIGNKIALVSIRDISKGCDLTISYLGHFYDYLLIPETRASQLITHFELWCNCHVCTENLNFSILKVGVLTTKEKACYDEWRKAIYGSKVLQKSADGVTTLNHEAAFKACRKAMSGLQYATGLRQHRDVYCVFSYLLKESQQEAILSYSEEKNKDDIIERLSF